MDSIEFLIGCGLSIGIRDMNERSCILLLILTTGSPQELCLGEGSRSVLVLRLPPLLLTE